MQRNLLLIPLALVVLLAGCSTPVPATTPAPASAVADASAQRFPDVTDVQVTRDGGQHSFAVTISSPYDTPERYADAFRVRAADGTVFGVNELTHDHATEQPFTRTLAGVTCRQASPASWWRDGTRPTAEAAAPGPCRCRPDRPMLHDRGPHDRASA